MSRYDTRYYGYDTGNTSNGFRNKKMTYTILAIPAAIVLIAFIAFLLQYIFFKIEKNDIYKLNKDIEANKYSLSHIDECNEAFGTLKLKEIYTGEELRDMTVKYRDYTLTLNGHKLESNIVSVPKGTSVLTLTEIATTSSFPYPIEVYGSLTDRNANLRLLSFLTVGDAQPEIKNEGNISSVSYPITGKSGETLTINISPVLAEKVGLDDIEIAIIFK